MPGEQRRRGHHEHLTPPASGSAATAPQPTDGRLAGNEPGRSGCEGQRLVPEHQELAVLDHLAPGQHRQAALHATDEQVDDRNGHSVMTSARQAAKAGSSNRTP